MRIELLRKYLYSQEFEIKLSHRLERLQKAENDPIERASLYYECANDVFSFIKYFGTVLEPRLPEIHDIPFFLFDYQVDTLIRVLEAEQKGHDLFIEKSRDMGISWLIIWYLLWRWLFQDKWYGLIGSRKEEEVDNKLPSSLFGKLRYAFYSLPKWIRPTKFSKSDHDVHMKLINPDRMSIIEGESANPNFGRGRRASIIYLDELFFWKFVRESWRACSDSSPCRIAVSTPYPSNFAKNFRNTFEKNNYLITLSWEQHPFKDKVWYEEEIKRREFDPLSINSEIDIQYSIDPTYAYYPEVANCEFAEIDYSDKLPLYIGADFGVRDKTAFCYVQKDKNYFYFLDGYQNSNKPLYFYLPFLKQGFDFKDKNEYIIENKFSKEKFVLKKSDYNSHEIDIIQRFNTWKKPIFIAGEIGHTQRMMKSNTSIFQELLGFDIYLRVNNLAFTHPVRRNAVKSILPYCKFSNKYNADIIYDALLNAKYPKYTDISIKPKDEPVHDETADMRSAVENFAVNIISQQKVKEIVYRKVF